MSTAISDEGDCWVFGYGSLIWRPGFCFLEQQPAYVRGWTRRFWQGSHDHRGVPDAPGRVVTLVAADDDRCDGVAYRISEQVRVDVFEQLDYREKNGYQRLQTPLYFHTGGETQGLVYIAPTDNHAYLGPAPLASIAEQIIRSCGPSGRNVDYLLDLAKALRNLGAADEHVFALENAVKQRLPT